MKFMVLQYPPTIEVLRDKGDLQSVPKARLKEQNILTCRTLMPWSKAFALFPARAYPERSFQADFCIPETPGRSKGGI